MKMRFWEIVKDKLVYIIFMIIILISSLLGNKADKLYNEEIVYITPKDSTIAGSLFSIKEIQTIGETHPYLWTSYGYKTTDILEKDNRKALVELVITNENYKKWNRLVMESGSFLVDTIYSEPQLVIDEEVAFQLIGEPFAKKQIIKLKGKEHQLKGVVRNNAYKRGQFNKEEVVGKAYAIGILEEEYTRLMPKGIVIGGLTGESLQDKQTILQVLVSLGKDKEGYHIISLNRYSKQIKECQQLLVGSVVVAIFIVLWKRLIARLSQLINTTKGKTKVYYLADYIKHKKWQLLLWSIIFIGAISITGMVGRYFIRWTLEIIVANKISLGQMEGLPYGIKVLQDINRINLAGLIFGEIILVWMIRQTPKSPFVDKSEQIKL